MNDDINNETDISYKFVLVGDSSVGKTCIFKKIAYNKFFKSNISTIGVDYKPLEYEIEETKNGKKIKMKFKIKLFDTAGQDRYRSLTKGYIIGSNGIIIVYDITKRSSFDNVIGWIKSIEEIYGKCEQIKACIFLIGNKKDLVEGEEGEKLREVQINEAENLAKKYDLIWAGEYSAKDNAKDKFDLNMILFAKIIYAQYGYEKPNKDSIIIDKQNVRRERRNNCNC